MLKCPPDFFRSVAGPNRFDSAAGLGLAICSLRFLTAPYSFAWGAERLTVPPLLTDVEMSAGLLQVGRRAEQVRQRCRLGFGDLLPEILNRPLFLRLGRRTSDRAPSAD